ncbi:hypothetical protein [Marinobacter sp. W-8]|uniref:hypothetical protein n=1 Tax=Marinobacter sp. W-8 TaxID=3369658 RepID=UPI0037C61689
MKYSTLYLHVGWSKTGTSAIQSQVQAQHREFLQKGILYPQALQWPDHSHHPFALAFNDVGGYQGQHTPAEALNQLQREMSSVDADSVLVSSELSPFYFSNDLFKSFVESNFETVKVIFTVRTQSELLLSLFNQLVKDPNVRYGASMFTLAMRNLAWLNFDQNVMRWSKVVGRENLHVVPYSREVVRDFFNLFDIGVSEGESGKIVNPSLPTRSLAILQARARAADNPRDFLEIRNRILSQLSEIPEQNDRYVLFSVPEQKAFDDHFSASNKKLADEFGFDISRLKKEVYEPVKVIPPGVRLPNE